MFKATVNQLLSQQKVTISIYKDTDGPTVKVVKRYGFTTRRIEPAQISMGLHFNDPMDAAQARQAEEWYHIAGATAETLDRIFQTREDLQRRIAIKVVGRTLTIDFVE